MLFTKCKTSSRWNYKFYATPQTSLLHLFWTKIVWNKKKIVNRTLLKQKPVGFSLELFFFKTEKHTVLFFPTKLRMYMLNLYIPTFLEVTCVEELWWYVLGYVFFRVIAFHLPDTWWSVTFVRSTILLSYLLLLFFTRIKLDLQYYRVIFDWGQFTFFPNVLNYIPIRLKIISIFPQLPHWNFAK